MLKNLCIIIWWLLCYGASFSQAPATQWARCYGGSSPDFFGESSQSIQQTREGGYVAIGRATSVDGDVSTNYGGTDMWLVKLDMAGTLSWETSIGGGSYDYGQSVEQTFDGGYIVAGYSISTGVFGIPTNGSNDCLVVKLDSSGNILWLKLLGGSGSDIA